MGEGVGRAAFTFSSGKVQPTGDQQQFDQAATNDFSLRQGLTGQLVAVADVFLKADFAGDDETARRLYVAPAWFSG